MNEAQHSQLNIHKALIKEYTDKARAMPNVAASYIGKQKALVEKGEMSPNTFINELRRNLNEEMRAGAVFASKMGGLFDLTRTYFGSFNGTTTRDALEFGEAVKPLMMEMNFVNVSLSVAITHVVEMYAKEIQAAVEKIQKGA